MDEENGIYQRQPFSADFHGATIWGIAPLCGDDMMGEKLIPSACEVDVTGALAMYALSLASQTPLRYC